MPVSTWYTSMMMLDAIGMCVCQRSEYYLLFVFYRNWKRFYFSLSVCISVYDLVIHFLILILIRSILWAMCACVKKSFHVNFWVKFFASNKPITRRRKKDFRKWTTERNVKLYSNWLCTLVSLLTDTISIIFSRSSSMFDEILNFIVYINYYLFQ